MSSSHGVPISWCPDFRVSTLSLEVPYNKSMHLYDTSTHFSQGEILRTRGGGHSIQFTDVEILKHNQPKTTKSRPRPQTPRNRPTRRSNRLANRNRPRGVRKSSESDLSSSASNYSGSSLDSSSEEQQWTDVETRVCVLVG